MKDPVSSKVCVKPVKLPGDTSPIITGCDCTSSVFWPITLKWAPLNRGQHRASWLHDWGKPQGTPVCVKERKKIAVSIALCVYIHVRGFAHKTPMHSGQSAISLKFRRIGLGMIYAYFIVIKVHENTTSSNELIQHVSTASNIVFVMIMQRYIKLYTFQYTLGQSHKN